VRTSGIETLRRTARRAANLFVPRAIILLYHRVAELSSDPQLLSVTPQHFAEHLEILRKHYRPIPLQQTDKLLRRSVVVTFDDGYADNLWNAKPLLERYDVPATVFVTTGYVGQDREFWWDELETLLLERRRLPETLQLNINGGIRQWELGASSDYDEDAYNHYRSWNVSQRNDPGPRQFVYRSLHQLLRPMLDRDQRKVLNQLSDLAGARSSSRSKSRPLSPAEVIELDKGGLVEVGSHTVTHPVLSGLSPAAQWTEIEQSKADLEAMLSRPVTSFGYPFGTRSDYAEETVAAIRRAGYHRACSNFAGVVGPDTDRFQLPRFVVRDWDGDEFSRRLSGWLFG
jgi:peptidoglycan/xylan/chitin deacetylase (PgdA/CDA1 family)